VVKRILIVTMLFIALADTHVNMEDTDFDGEVPLLLDQGYECSQNQEVTAPSDDDLGVESLDYDPVHNVVYEKLKKRQCSRKFYGYYALSTDYKIPLPPPHLGQ
jgi:hypothetical protein